MTKEELETYITSINSRLSQLEKNRPGTYLGGDPEFFDQPSRLTELESKVRILRQLIEELQPGSARRFDDLYKNDRSLAEHPSVDIRKAVFGDQEK